MQIETAQRIQIRHCQDTKNSNAARRVRGEMPNLEKLPLFYWTYFFYFTAQMNNKSRNTPARVLFNIKLSRESDRLARVCLSGVECDNFTYYTGHNIFQFPSRQDTVLSHAREIVISLDTRVDNGVRIRSECRKKCARCDEMKATRGTFIVTSRKQQSCNIEGNSLANKLDLIMQIHRPISRLIA